MAKSKKQKAQKVQKARKGEICYLVAAKSINQETKLVGNVPGVPEYQIVGSFKKAKKLVLEIAKRLNTADSKFAIQPLDEFGDDSRKLHAIAHLFFDDDFHPVAEADNKTSYGSWYSITIDIHQLTVQ